MCYELSCMSYMSCIHDDYVMHDMHDMFYCKQTCILHARGGGVLCTLPMLFIICLTEF